MLRRGLPQAIRGAMHAITKYRTEANISIEDLAEQIPITRQALWRIETGKSRPSHRTMVRLHDITGIPFSDLVRADL